MSWQRNFMGAAWARHDMCESALNVCYQGRSRKLAASYVLERQWPFSWGFAKSLPEV